MSLPVSLAEGAASYVVEAPTELQTIESFVALMIAATIVGVLAHRIKLPYTVLLILMGVAMAALDLVPNIKLTQDLLMMVFLPALLFEAAIHFPARELRQFAPTIITLAAPGVLLTAVATAYVLDLEFTAFHITKPLQFLDLLLFGTIIAATDAISVITLFRQLGVDRKLSLIMEGESLFNDGTAIVLYTVVLHTIQSGSVSVSDGIVQFAFVGLGGIFVGALLGLFASLMISFMDDRLISIAFTTVVAYGSYLAAEELQVSGVLATVTAGLFVGNLGKRKGMSSSTRLSVVSFWEYLAFFVGSIVFLMMGLEVNVPFLLDNTLIIFLAFLAVLASRAISVYAPIPLLKRMRQPIDMKVSTILWWGGLRGSLSMVLVLSLPHSIPAREALIAMVFGVVVLSVVVQGSTMGFLLKMLSFISKRTEAEAFLGKSLARLKAISAQQQALQRLTTQDLEGVKDISARLHAQRGATLQSLESKMADPDFKAAVAKKTKENELYIVRVAEDSYRQSVEDNILTAHEADELTSELPESPAQ